MRGGAEEADPRWGRRRGEERLEGGLDVPLICPDVERVEEELEVLAVSRVVLAEERLRPLLGPERRVARGTRPSRHSQISMTKSK